MSAFDKVIGYRATKQELLQICDMLRDRTIYEEMGARMPHGLLLYGEPGLGKTLLAKCFLAESGLNTITVRRDKGGDAFIDSITQAFAKATAEAPAIVFLDDMDKFANEDSSRCDAPEYVAVQAGIDTVKDDAVFVIATANDIRKLPDSLRRSGRFDRKIGLCAPTASDAEEIIAYYLKGKKVSGSVDLNDLAKMISYHSCAELETILNEAAVHAAFARKASIEMEDLVSTVLKQQYGAQEDISGIPAEVMEKVALHEAGHLAVLRLVGGQIEQFTLTPFGGELRIRRSEWLSYGKEIASVLAGPGVNLVCALVLGRAAAELSWERGYLLSGIHMLLALFNLLPLRQLDGGRALYLMLSWLLDPITADRIGHGVGCFFLCVALLLTAALQGAVGLQLPLVVLEFWFVLCWCAETGIVKSRLCG